MEQAVLPEDRTCHNGQSTAITLNLSSQRAHHLSIDCRSTAAHHAAGSIRDFSVVSSSESMARSNNDAHSAEAMPP